MRHIAAVAAVLAVAGCSALSQPAEVTGPPMALSVTGTITVPLGSSSGWFGSPGDPCATDGGYKDIAQGAQVVVSDASGTTLALGALDPGSIDETGLSCAFSFTVSNVPAGHQFYGVEVSHRGRLQYTPDDLKNPLMLTLKS